GFSSSKWRRIQMSHALTSSGSGSRFSGGRCRTTLVMKTFERSSPMPASSSSSSCPAAPTNGRPCTSSWYPGASPRKKIPDSPLLLEREEVQHVHDGHGVALGGRCRNDVADLEAQPLRVADRSAGDLDLPCVEIHAEHPARRRRLAQQAGEQPVPAAEVHDE